MAAADIIEVNFSPERPPPTEPRDPEAVAILTGDNVSAIRRIERGDTLWQQRVDRMLSLMFAELQSIKRALFLWPSFAVLACLLLGSYAAVLTWLLTRH
jgi:hypothetical protein